MLNSNCQSPTLLRSFKDILSTLLYGLNWLLARVASTTGRMPAKGLWTSDKQQGVLQHCSAQPKEAVLDPCRNNSLASNRRFYKNASARSLIFASTPDVFFWNLHLEGFAFGTCFFLRNFEQQCLPWHTIVSMTLRKVFFSVSKVQTWLPWRTPTLSC